MTPPLSVRDLAAFGIVPKDDRRCSKCANYKTPRVEGNTEVGVCGTWGNPTYGNGYCQKWTEARSNAK